MTVNSPSVGSTGSGELWSSWEPACHLPFSGPRRKATRLPSWTYKDTPRNPSNPKWQATSDVFEKNTDKVVCLISRSHSDFYRQTLSGGFSFSGPPHVAHPWCLPPLMLDVWRKFGAKVSLEGGGKQRNVWRSPALLVFCDTNWLILRDEICRAPYLSFSSPHPLCLSLPVFARASRRTAASPLLETALTTTACRLCCPVSVYTERWLLTLSDALFVKQDAFVGYLFMLDWFLSVTSLF